MSSKHWKIVRAEIMAHKAHENQKRKYSGEPYFVHVEEVAKLVESVGGTPEMIAAAYLHDSVEDTGMTLKEIEESLGPEVAALVEMMTDPSKPEDGNRATRKSIDRMHTAKSSPEGKTIKLADLISNSKDILEKDPNFAVPYLKEKELLMPFLIEGNPVLYAQALTYLPKGVISER